MDIYLIQEYILKEASNKLEPCDSPVHGWPQKDEGKTPTRQKIKNTN